MSDVNQIQDTIVTTVAAFGFLYIVWQTFRQAVHVDDNVPFDHEAATFLPVEDDDPFTIDAEMIDG